MLKTAIFPPSINWKTFMNLLETPLLDFDIVKIYIYRKNIDTLNFGLLPVDPEVAT